MNLANIGLVFAAEVAGGSRGLLEEFSWRVKGGGYDLIPIFACLIVVLFIMVERGIALYARYNISKDAFLRGLRKHLYAGDLDKAVHYVTGQKATPLTAVVKAGLLNVPRGEEDVQAALDEAALREMPKVEARSGYLAMLGNAAMLLGLLGTVSGLIGAFAAVASASAQERATMLAAEISKAMNCTYFGLAVAIPALVAFSIFMGRTQALINDINETSVAVLNLVVNNKEKFKNTNVQNYADE
ncbi:MAG: MotA/TolQ/ExbB proton channel family protein [Cystobacterineae bacterium]|nr:MotA/TolQ/ExbB proton channel family protein [Cystobacterineae bacterium]